VRLETERLILRPVCTNDLDDLASLYSDPEVVKYLATGVLTKAEVKQKLDLMVEHWQKHGYGVWALIHKTDGRFIGRCGIGHFHELDAVELAYTLAKPYWGCGLACEAARAAILFGFDQLGLPRVVAYARKENIASQRVMAKIGMTYREDTQYAGKDAVVYTIENPQYQFVPLDGSQSTG